LSSFRVKMTLRRLCKKQVRERCAPMGAHRSLSIRKVVMKLDLKNIKRVNIKLPDQFERDALRRQRALDDSGIVEQVDDLRINSNPADEPDELRAMLNMSVEPDYSDEKFADIVPMSVSEVLCPETFLWVARNFECVCGDSH